MSDDELIPITSHSRVASDMALDECLGKFGTDSKLRDKWTDKAVMAQNAMVTSDPYMLDLKQRLILASTADEGLPPSLKQKATCMIYGESGTGKELCAQILHGKRRGPFIPVNCSAIPRELFEAEFFGSAKGSYTDSKRDVMGKFEAAEDGTLFLDEIGDIAWEHQMKLLRVIESREVTRVGEHKPRRINCFIVSATNQDMKAKVKNGTFRRDLFYRLATFEFETKPLHERPGDVPLILNAWRRQHDLTHDDELPPLEVYKEGNVRALLNWALRKECGLT